VPFASDVVVELLAFLRFPEPDVLMDGVVAIVGPLEFVPLLAGAGDCV
jgi:hypothetical protein